MSTAQDIRAALEPVLAPLGLVVEDVSVSVAGRQRLVRVLVDADISGLDVADATSPVPPLSLELVTDATRAVSDELDATDVMGSAPYKLEVSSPGVGRPLSTRDQLRRQVGRLVEVEHTGGTDTGRLVEVGADALVLDVPAGRKTPARRVEVDLEAVRRGIVQVEFSRPSAAAPAADDTDADDSDLDDSDLVDLEDSDDSDVDDTDTNDLNDTNARADHQPATEGDS